MHSIDLKTSKLIDDLVSEDISVVGGDTHITCKNNDSSEYPTFLEVQDGILYCYVSGALDDFNTKIVSVTTKWLLDTHVGHFKLNIGGSDVYTYISKLEDQVKVLAKPDCILDWASRWKRIKAISKMTTALRRSLPSSMSTYGCFYLHMSKYHTAIMLNKAWCDDTHYYFRGGLSVRKSNMLSLLDCMEESMKSKMIYNYRKYKIDGMLVKLISDNDSYSFLSTTARDIIRKHLLEESR